MFERQRQFPKEQWPRINGLLAVALLGVYLASCVAPPDKVSSSPFTGSTLIENPFIFAPQDLDPQQKTRYPYGSCHRDEATEERVIWKRIEYPSMGEGWVGPWESLEECQRTPVNLGLDCPADKIRVCYENDHEDPEKSHRETVEGWFSCEEGDQEGDLYGPFSSEKECTKFDDTTAHQATPFPDVTSFLDISGRNYISQTPPWLALEIAIHFPPDEWTNAARIAEAESGYRKDAVSPTGAIGVFQISPKWQKKNLNSLNLSTQDLYNPGTNVRVAASIRKQWGNWQAWATAAGLGIK